MNEVEFRCHNSILIGSNTTIAHQSLITDEPKQYNFNYSEVKIGKRCWICNRVKIYGDSYISGGSIVSSDSIMEQIKITDKNILIGGSSVKIIRKDVTGILNPAYEIIIDGELDRGGSNTYIYPEQWDYKKFCNGGK